MLNDAAAYFEALRHALLLAEEQVYIIGWDIHSQTRLVGACGVAKDGFPEQLGPFLKALLLAKPRLRINILIWNFAPIYAAEREWDSARKFTVGAPDRLCFCHDASLPLGSAQHQKIVVIDKAAAFVGGLDLTIRRWDTSEHRVSHPQRCDPARNPYGPFHDVQCMVDGEAAAFLGVLAERRWLACGQKVIDCEPSGGNRWPASVPVHARGLICGIARTEVETAANPKVDEVARLFKACFAAARQFVYIENQFTSAADLAHVLAQRMQEAPSLRALIVLPQRHSSWLESQAMQSGRGRFIDPFVSAGVTDRVRFVYPVSRDRRSEAPVMVHSKLMIIDDHMLRIGSANLNNRSMGADTECDLVFEAASQEHSDFIAQVRRRLIGHFCGVREDDIKRNEADLFAFIDDLSARRGPKSLEPIDFAAPTGGEVVALAQSLADPERPLGLDRAASRMWSTRTILGVLGITAALAGLALAWYCTPLSGFANVGVVSAMMSQYANLHLAPLLAIAAFVGGGLIAFPVLVLIAATAAALGPWQGFFTAIAGVILSALLLFAIGRVLGQKRLQRLFGRRAARVQARIVGKGIIAVTLIRMVPVAPFSIVNVAAGASKLTLRDYLIGTLLGMTPGILAMSALGSQIADLARNASWSSALLLGLAFAAWIAICFGAQFLVTWLAARQP